MAAPISEREWQLYDQARERDKFNDWITRGNLPAEVHDRPRVRVDSLEGLVDGAIDCDRRLIEDRDRGAYYVVDGDLSYTYDPSVGRPPALVDAVADGAAAGDGAGPSDRAADG